MIPLRFAYFKYVGKADETSLLQWAREIKSEHNSVVEGFRKMQVKMESVIDSQSVLHLKSTTVMRINVCGVLLVLI